MTDIAAVPEALKLLKRRFWAKVHIGPDCWLWTGAIKSKLPNCDYGQFYIGGKVKLAHRVLWEFYNGPIPAGLVICHTCDTPRCVRPSHLFMGTQDENMKDSIAKGRLYAWHKRATHCKRHHLLSGDNIRVVPHNNGTKRVCRTCQRDRERERYRRNRPVEAGWPK